MQAGAANALQTELAYLLFLIRMSLKHPGTSDLKINLRVLVQASHKHACCWALGTQDAEAVCTSNTS